MLPFLLILGLFTFCTAVGQAVLSGLKVRFGVLWSWLLAPTMGMCIIILCVTAWSKWGQPVKVAGPWVTLALALGTIGVFLWRRPKFPFRRLAPYGAILILYILYGGWPMFKFGFKWISYANDDMANYTLAAERFLNNSYYFLPEQTELEGRDYSQHFWFMHALQQIRPGSEMMLAWTCSLTGLNPHQIFMPVIFVMALMQLCSLGALVLYAGRNRRLAVISVALLCISPLFSLGTLYQLIAQVGGISVLICACSLILRDVRFRWNTVAATGLLLAGMGEMYPEVAPFIGLSILLYLVWLRYTRPEGFGILAKRVIAMAVLTFLIMGTNTYEFFNTMILQSLGSAGLGAMADISRLEIEGLVLFPWTLVPSFIPMIFGLWAFGVVGGDPIISIVILLGMALFVYLIVRVVIRMRQGSPPAVLGAIMVPLGVYLFSKHQDFGLFKLGMFAQGVIAFFLAEAVLWVWRRWGRRAAIITFVVYSAAAAPSLIYYVISSLGSVGGGLSEVVGASAQGVAFKPPTDVKFDAIESDMTNVVNAKLFAMYTRGIDTRFLSRNYMDNVANVAPLEFLRNPNPEYGDRRSQMLRPLHYIRWMLPDEIMKGNVAAYNMMPMTSIDNSWSETSFRHLDYKHPLFVTLDTKYDHFNKFDWELGMQTGWHKQGLYMYRPLSEVKDRLIFIHSEKGPHYYSSARYRAAFFQREPEPVSGNKLYFHGTGRYAMFEILNPSAQKLRLEIDFTRTSLGGERSYLPTHAIVSGEDDYPIPFVGSGSARIFTQPIKPAVFEGLSYVTLDFGENPAMILKKTTGLMKLYGQAYNLDDRRLVGFTRDISVVTEDEYRRMKRPTRIAKLPDDLYANPGFEYSGIFEDGWLANRAYMCLGAAKKGDVFTFRGEVPDLSEFRSGLTLVLTLNGRATEPITLHPGTFTINRFIAEDSDVTRVNFAFSQDQIYGAGDLRKVSAFMYECGVRPLDDLIPLNHAVDRNGDSLQIQGLATDGWASKAVSFHLPPTESPKVLDLQFEFPSWAGGSAGSVDIAVDGRTVNHLAVKVGTYKSVEVPILAGGEKIVTIRAAGDFRLPGQDRLCSYRIIKMRFRDPRADERVDAGGLRTVQPYQWTGVDADGWSGKAARLFIARTAKERAAEIEFEFPGWAPVKSGKFAFTLDGRPVYAQVLPNNTYKTVRVPLEPNLDHEIVIETGEEFLLPAPDNRVRSFRIVRLRLN
jgi:hypothetical protein